MAVLGKLDASLGPGVMDRPAFPLGISKPLSGKAIDDAMLGELKDGKYDGLFSSEKKLSELYRESQEPYRLPSIQLLSVNPVSPLSADLPLYPPIARAAHVEGKVNVSFQVSPVGRVESLSYNSGPELLRRSVSDAIFKWQFDPSAQARHEEATVAFMLNCPN